jgi:hypothetical protein
MRSARLALLLPIVLLATLIGTPAGVLAADPLVVTGKVVRDGSAVTGVAVTVSVTGSDQVASATTDDLGAFSVQVEAGVGDELQVFATGQTSRSDPDANGCVTSETPTGHLVVTLDSLQPAPLVVLLDKVVTGTACGATATPHPTARPHRTTHAGATPPSTDAIPGGGTPGSGTGLPIVVAVLTLAGAVSLALVRGRA